MEFEPHGTFELTRKGDIIIIRFYHSWNLESAKAFFCEYKVFLQQHQLSKFGVLSDLRKIKGGTPDAIEYFKYISDWAQDRGQATRVLLINSGLKAFAINRIDRGEKRFPAKPISSDAEALAWFEFWDLAVS